MDQDVVVPIRPVVGADGQTLYTITIRIGKSRPIEVLLDTGSVGLRVLSTALVGSDVRPTSTTTVTVNAIGLELTGHVGKGTLTLGEANSSNAIPFQIIETTACLTTSDGCDPGRAAPGKFRFTSARNPGGGAEAIFGIRGFQPVQPGSPGNPLLDLGYTRWVVHLPSQGRDGELRLQPSEETRKAFKVFPLLLRQIPGTKLMGVDDSVPGCLVSKSDGALCSPIAFDTGGLGRGVHVFVPNLGRPYSWPVGTAGRLAFGEGSAKVSADFTSDAAAAQIFVAPAPPKLEGGMDTEVLPYLLFDVLYDTENRSIGLKRRTPES